MRIWVVKYGESIPFASTSTGHHFFRSGELTRRLAERGHEVTWWTGRFEHQTKRHLDIVGDRIDIPGTKSSVRLLASRGYRSNFSPARFYDHWEIARNFRKAIPREPRPDVIVASMPTPELAAVATEYARAAQVPLIIDVRDMWPDAITDRLRDKFRFSLNWLFRSYDEQVRRCTREALSLTAISEQMLEWAQEKGARPSNRRDDDRVFRLASRQQKIDPSRLGEMRKVWRGRGFDPGAGRKVFAWAGSLTDQKATRALLEAQALLPDEVRRAVQVVICGKGDLEREVRAAGDNFPQVLYAGFVPRDEVQFLYDNSDFGLLFYDNTPDFQGSFPNKFGEYLMSGLPVVTTIDGAMQREYGKAGFITTVAPTPAGIASALSELAFSERNDEVRSNARAVFQRDFDADIVYEAFCDHVEHCGNGNI